MAMPSEQPTPGSEQYRVRIWKGRNPDGEDYEGEPDEIPYELADAVRGVVEDQRKLVTDGGTDSTGEGRSLDLSERQLERFDEIKQEWTEGGHLPEPDDELVLKGLMDTHDAVDAGHYSQCDSTVCRIVRRFSEVFGR